MDEIKQLLETMESRLSNKMDSMQQEIKHLNKRIDSIETKMNSMEEKANFMELKMNSIEENLNSTRQDLIEKMDSMESRLNDKTSVVKDYVVDAIHEAADGYINNEEKKMNKRFDELEARTDFNTIAIENIRAKIKIKEA